MSEMVVFEAVSLMKNKEIRKFFIANYVIGDERLFEVNLEEAEILVNDKDIRIRSFTTITRYTDCGFIRKQFQLGDKVALTARGGWEIKRSWVGSVMLVFKKVPFYWKKAVFWMNNLLKKDDLGTIERQFQQNFCWIERR